MSNDQVVAPTLVDIQKLIEKLLKKSESPDAGDLENLKSWADSGVLPDVEQSLCQQMGWIAGTPDVSLLSADHLAAFPKILRTYVSHPSCHLGPAELLQLTQDQSLKLSPAVFVAKYKKHQIEDFEALVNVATDVLKSFLGEKKFGDGSKFLEKVFVPINPIFSVEQMVRALQDVYSVFDLEKKQPKSLRKYVALLFSILTSEKNQGNFAESIGIAETLKSPSFANFIKAMSDEPGNQSSAKGKLLIAVLTCRSRDLVTVLSQQGVLDDFDLLEIGDLLSVDVISTTIDGHDKVRLSVISEITKKSRKAEPSDSIAAFVKYPVLMDWVDFDLYLKKIEAVQAPLISRLFVEGARLQSTDAKSKSEIELHETKKALAESQIELRELRGKVSELRASLDDVTERLRASKQQGSSLRTDEIRMAQFDVLKRLVEVLDRAHRSRHSPESIESMIDFFQNELAQFGVRVFSKIGDTVSFNVKLHIGDSCTNGMSCQVVEPGYELSRDNEVVILKRATVTPL
jgi:molecular chaperone GrpE (heat shock protein)